MTKKKIAIIIASVLGAIILCLVALGLGYYFYLDSKITSGKAGSLPEDVKTGEIIPDEVGIKPGVHNLLVCGIVYQNEQEAASEKGLTDVMLYVNLVTDNAGNVKANILQIPRDTYVGADKSISGRLNSVYANGPDQENLMANLATRISEDFKLPIDNYVVIEMDACKDIIDTMGGIDMYVPWDVTNDDGQVMVEQGNHHISGDTAEFIVRQRNSYAQKDFKRLEMQQYFYKAVFQTVRKDFPLSEAPLMANKVIHYSKTDMNLSELMSLCMKVIKLSDENIFVMRMPGGAFSVDIPGMNGAQSVYGINAEKLAPLLNQHFRTGSAPVEASEMEILTGFDYPLGETYDEGKSMADVAVIPEG